MPGPESPSQLNAQHFTFWTLSSGSFHDRHEVDIPPTGASLTNNVTFFNGFLRSRAGYKRVPIELDDAPGYFIDLYRPVFATNDRSGHLMLAKRDSGGSVHVYKLSVATPCDTSVVNNSELIASIPAGPIPYYYDRDGTPVFNSDTAAEEGYLHGGAYNTIQASATSFKGNWYFAPGDDDIYRYNGTTFVPLRTLQPDRDLQNPIGARIITSNDARLFIADCIDPVTGVRVPYRIAWSATLEDNRWGGSYYQSGTSAYLDLAGENEGITAMYTSGDLIVVFKPRTIYVGQFVGAPQYYSFRRLVRGPGCISHATLKEYRDGFLIWLGDDNIYLGYPGQKPKAMGPQVSFRIREMANLCRMNEARAVIDRDNDIYRIIVPIRNDSNPHPNNEVVQNYKIFELYIPSQGWFEGVIADPDVNIMSSIETRTNWWVTNNYVSSFDGQVYEQLLGHNTDGDTPYPCEYVTGVFNGEKLTSAATQQINVQTIRVQATGGEVELSHIWGNNLERWQSKAFGTQVSDGESNLYVPGRTSTSENFKLRLYQEDSRKFGKVAAISVSAVLEGDTRYLR